MGFFVYNLPYIVGEFFVDFIMNWLKKPASPMLRNIFLVVMSISVIAMILIGEYIASSVFALIVLGDILTNKNRTK